MDYQKIYADFITDRTLTAPTEAYTELHHILPRALGGSDAPTNLIALTARDHYFAHCCLAKIHGGGMWHALALMGRTQKRSHGAGVFRMGRLYAISKKRDSELRSVKMKKDWADGTFKRNRVYQPISEAHRAAVSAASSRPRPGRKEEAAKALATKQAKAPRFEFVEISSGRAFGGTALEFRRMSGVSQAYTSLLVSGKVEVAKGWVLRGNETKPRGNRDRTVRVFKHPDGRVFEGTAYEFNALYIKDSGMLSNCINGKNGVKSARGWLYAGEK